MQQYEEGNSGTVFSLEKIFTKQELRTNTISKSNTFTSVYLHPYLFGKIPKESSHPPESFFDKQTITITRK